MQLDGHCSCGGASYRLHARPMFVHCCHCRYCQRETGSAFIINALVERDKVELLSGEVEEVLTPTASGKGQRIIRCAECHVALWSHYAYGSIGSALAFLRVGTLTEPDRCPPDIHIFTESKQAWLLLPETAQVVSAFYKASDYWPEDSLARRAALFAAASADG